MQTTIQKEQNGSFIALIPFLVFLVFYLGLSILANDFYKVPMPIAFIVASAAAILLNRKIPLTEKVDVYAKGMGDTNIMIMCLVFILAGAFATVSKGMGAVNAAVTISRVLIPDSMMVFGIFLVSSFISLAIGTSCGTIATITPIAVGLGAATGLSTELLIGAVIGGAMFGDNMSMISDTTIAATRTQNVTMRDKFLVNLKFALPAAVITLVIYLIAGKNQAAAAVAGAAVTWRDILLVMPYILVLAAALCGMNVMAVLFGGIIVSGVIGICMNKFDFWATLKLTGDGSLGMAETLIVALLAGGLLSLIRYNGGIKYLIAVVEKCIFSRRACEFGVALLVTAVNLFTANNTVAIVIAGPIANELSRKYDCDPKRIASILDATSCVIQGVIPYGAQILIAIGIAQTAELKVSTLHLLGSMYYQMLLAVALIVFIVIGGKKVSTGK